jgi:hypothetical protein
MHSSQFDRLLSLFNKQTQFKTLLTKLSNLGVVTGGALVYALNDFVPKSTVGDVDVFLLGCDNEIKCLSYLLTINTCIRDLNLDATYASHGASTTAVVDIKFAGENVNVQLIFTNMTNAEDVVNNFDLDYVQSYYYCAKLYSSNSAALSYKKREISQFYTPSFKWGRFEKAAQKGFKTVAFGAETNVLPEFEYMQFGDFMKGKITFSAMANTYYERRQTIAMSNPVLESIVLADNVEPVGRFAHLAHVPVTCKLRFGGDYVHTCKYFSARIVIKNVIKSRFLAAGAPIPIKLDKYAAPNTFFLNNFDAMKLVKSGSTPVPLNKAVSVIVKPYAYKPKGSSETILRCYVELVNDNILALPIAKNFAVKDHQGHSVKKITVPSENIVPTFKFKQPSRFVNIKTLPVPVKEDVKEADIEDIKPTEPLPTDEVLVSKEEVISTTIIHDIHDIHDESESDKKNIERIKLIIDTVTGKTKAAKIKSAAFNKYLELSNTMSGTELYTEVCSYAVKLLVVKDHAKISLASNLVMGIKVDPVGSFDDMIEFVNGF